MDRILREQRADENKKVPDGAPEQLWKTTSGFGGGGTWGRNGTILVGYEGLLAIPSAGGSPVALKLPIPHSMALPHFLPDGEHFVFVEKTLPPSGSGPALCHVSLGGWSNGKWTLHPVPLKASHAEARYTSVLGGALLYLDGDNLYAQKLNWAEARLDGSPLLVEGPVAGSDGSVRTADFSVSGDGVLVWRAGHKYSEQLTWFDRQGKVLETPLDRQATIFLARLSPDEKRIASLAWTESGSEVRVFGIAENGFLNILNPNPRHRLFNSVLWRPDSLHLLYTWSEPGGTFLTEQAADGSGEARELGKLPGLWVHDVAVDGRLLMMVDGGRGHQGDLSLHLMPLSGDRKPRPLLATDEQTAQGSFSPDRKWVLFSSAPTHELFVQAFPISGLRKQISSGGGRKPIWRSDGREIVYLGPDDWVYSVRLDASRGEFHTQPQRLFPVRTSPNSLEHSTLAVTRDGSRILFNQAVDPAGIASGYGDAYAFP